MTVYGLIASASHKTLDATELTQIERRLLADAADGDLDDFRLLEGALIASGVADYTGVETYVSRFAGHLPILRGKLKDKVPTLSRADTVLRHLHDEVLVADYVEECTEIDRVLDTGNYNCVSATVLYHCLCREFELSPIPVATKSHVFSRFQQDKMFDVETTCGDWFQVTARDCQAKIRESSQTRRQLSDVNLLGMIYYNRGVSLLEVANFSAAIEVLRIAHQLDPEARSVAENLRAAINNWALFECEQERFQQAATLIGQGLAEDPDYSPFLANDLHIHQRWAIHLCRDRQFSEALTVLDQAHARRPDVDLFNRGRFAIYHEWAEALRQAGEFIKADELSRLVTKQLGAGTGCQGSRLRCQ